MKRYPSGDLTPHGWWHLVSGNKPMMWLEAYDESLAFDLLGGLAAPYNDPTKPEAVVLKGLKGLIPPWKHIQQKGATQDGVTHIDALLDPIEVEADLECIGRDWQHTARVVRDLIASIDAIQQSSLHFYTHDIGHWWADIRWYQGAPPNPLELVRGGQPLPLRLQADNACWRTYEYADAFAFSYEDMTDTFTVDNRPTQDLGDIPQHYTGDGGGFCTSYNGRAFWWDDPEDPFTTEERRVINGPWPDFETTTDNQVINQVHDTFQEWSFPDSARNILAGRMGKDVDGNWDGSGVFVEYGGSYLRLFHMVDFVETTMRSNPLAMLIPPVPGEKFTLVCGYEGNPRMFKVLRNGVEILSHKETGTGSPMGADNRGIGNGMYAASALITQATPAAIRKISAGDNAEVSQSGFVKMLNVGDQRMYWDATIFGPCSKVRIYDGPGSEEYIEFGPLLPNQIVFLRTDPRSNTTLVQDLTAIPPTPQELNIFQDAVRSLLSFFSNQNAFTDQIESMFGIVPPQGNFYKYLNGRFSDNAAIPPKSPGDEAKPYFVKVEIDGGNADSKVILSGVPLRRYPL